MPESRLSDLMHEADQIVVMTIGSIKTLRAKDGPGIANPVRMPLRARCDALHWGWPYLHDVLEAVRLPENLTAAPPIELWPTVIARVPVPEDVEQALLMPLREAG